MKTYRCFEARHAALGYDLGQWGISVQIGFSVPYFTIIVGPVFFELYR